MKRFYRRRSPGALLSALLIATPIFSACSASRPVPPGPTLPAVGFVPPCDPKAAIALTPEQEKQLVLRDRLMQERIKQLEDLLGGGN